MTMTLRFCKRTLPTGLALTLLLLASPNIVIAGSGNGEGLGDCIPEYRASPPPYAGVIRAISCDNDPGCVQLTTPEPIFQKGNSGCYFSIQELTVPIASEFPDFDPREGRGSCIRGVSLEGPPENCREIGEFEIKTTGKLEQDAEGYYFKIILNFKTSKGKK